MTDEELESLRRAFRESEQWTLATLANNFLMNFTDPWPEGEAADLMREAMADKRKKLWVKE